MSTEYRINNFTRFWMLSLAISFDLLQFLTPGILDKFITLIATIVFGMLFAEKGALTMKGKGIIRILKLLGPISDIIIGNIPGITLTVWAQIEESRIIDKVAPDSAKAVLQNKQKLKSPKRGVGTKVTQDTIQNPTKYGKGRRGQRTLSREYTRSINRNTHSKQRSLQNTKLPSKHML